MPSSRTENASSGHACAHAGFAQWLHRCGRKFTCTWGTWPHVRSSTFTQNWPVSGWGLA